MNDKVNVQLALLRYIQEKMRHKLEEIELYLRDVDTTITEIEVLVNGDKKD
jgi:hypothetical protein